MGHPPTRAALGAQIRELQDNGARQAREIEMLRKELAFTQERERATRQEMGQLSTDRERLTATVECLARRLASDRPQYWTPANQAQESPRKL